MAIFSLDLETTGFDLFKDRIFLASWCGTDLAPHCEEWSPSVRARIQRMIGDPKNTIITQNGVFDYSFLAKDGLISRSKRHDTMIGSHVLYSNLPASLEALVDRYLTIDALKQAGLKLNINKDWKTKGPEAWCKENKKWFTIEHGRPPNFSDAPRAETKHYARQDALYTLLVWFCMKLQLTGRNEFSYNLDMSMVPILVGMKLRGIPVDIESCRRNIVELTKKQNSFLRRFRIDKVGPKALRDIIFPALKIKLKYKTEAGNWKFDEKTMRRYQVAYPKAMETIEDVIQFRKARQSSGTYYHNFIYFSHHGKIFPNFHLTKAKTSRLSSSAPNLQNVKKKGDERKVFLVRPGHIALHWDYDAIELRLLAHYSREKALLRVFRKGIDPHTRTAELMGIDEKSAAKYLSGKYRGQKPRFIGKQLNYSYWYGMGVDALCLDLGIKRRKGQELFDAYRAAYPDAVAWSRQLIRDAKQIGFVEDILGRRYRPDDQYSFYKLVNYLIQGTAAQVMKIGMRRAQQFLMYHRKDADVIRVPSFKYSRGILTLTIHDEIGLDAPDDRNAVEPLITGVTKALTITDLFLIPLTVSCKWSRTNWKELVEVSEKPIPW